MTDPYNAPKTSQVSAEDDHLRSYSVYTLCKHCNKGAPTSVTASINICNFICCCFFTECWLCYMICKRKDINCYDAGHICSQCNAPVGNYSSC